MTAGMTNYTSQMKKWRDTQILKGLLEAHT